MALSRLLRAAVVGPRAPPPPFASVSTDGRFRPASWPSQAAVELEATDLLRQVALRVGRATAVTPDVLEIPSGLVIGGPAVGLVTAHITPLSSHSAAEAFNSPDLFYPSP
eukprot:93015-Prorocentrum_minimum.AAC.1